MTKLTAKERRQVLDAAELIESGEAEVCCEALRRSTEQDLVLEKFCAFYGKSRGNDWIGLMLFEAFDDDQEQDFLFENSREIRVLWLLWFAEVG